MKMASDNNSDKRQLEIKVRGDLRDFQIVEEEEDGDNECRSKEVCVSEALPQGIVKPSSLPVFGSVRVSKSENVQFGNNTYFNGPVTIKQVIQPKYDHDNLGFQNTEEDILGTITHELNKEKPVVSDAEKSHMCVKGSYFSIVIVIIVGAVCAIVSLSVMYTAQHDSAPIHPIIKGEEESAQCIMVEGMVLQMLKNVKNMPFYLLSPLMLLIYTCRKLLTKETGSRDFYSRGTTISATVRTRPVSEKSNCKMKEDPLLIAPTHLRIVPRIDWLAQPVEKPLDPIRLPVPWVIIQHTATESCLTQSECVRGVRLIQMYHIESRGWYDIGYNFLVGGDGSAYFGRGWEYQGAHTLGYNKYSMGIAFIGTFNNEPPPKKQLDACKKLINKGVEMGKIVKDYKLFAHRQLASTLSPGDKLYEILKEWPNFVKNITSLEEMIPNY